MVIKFFHAPTSGPSRAGLMVARAVGVPLEIRTFDLGKKEQINEEFLKINPQHCVPTIIDDDGFIVWESKAIAGYLVDKYGKDDTLYPKDLKIRTLINQRLYYDASSLYALIQAICYPIRYLGETEIKEDGWNNLNRTLGFLDIFLSSGKWLAGDDHYTIADICIYASLSSILAVGWDISSFPNIQRWVNDCVILPGYEENQEGATIFGEMIKSKLKK